MQRSIQLDGPADLAALGEFLASERMPPGCMQLAALDGFLAGIIVGPETIPPSVWLPIVWGCDDEPIFADHDEAQTILGIILRRYNEIIRLIDSPPGAYRPVMVERDDGTIDPSSWAIGFLQAMTLCQDGWEPLIRDTVAGPLIAPIMLLASTTSEFDLALDEDERLPDAEMAKLIAEAPSMLSLCVSGMRVFFQTRRKAPPRKSGRRPKRKRR